MTRMNFNPIDREDFVNLICGQDEPLFQTIADRPDCTEPPRTIQGRKYTLLEAANEAGAGICLTINATRGDRRTAGDVTRIRALFIDCDEVNVDEAVDKIGVRPHAIVKTSPGKGHAYWLVSDCPVESFAAHQTALAEFVGSDRKATDVARIMRVPGFFHMKKEPFLSYLDELGTNPVPYSVVQVMQNVPPVSVKPALIVPRGEAVSSDPVVQALKDRGLYLQRFRDGKIGIKCPLGTGHEPGSTSSTVYMPARTDGVPGRFNCQHESCHGKTQKDFFEAVGMPGEFKPFAQNDAEEALRVLGVQPRGDCTGDQPVLNFDCTDDGKVLPTLENLRRAVQFYSDTVAELWLNDRTGVLVHGDRRITDDDRLVIRAFCEKVRVPCRVNTKSNSSDVIDWVASTNRRHDAQAWLKGLKWDGVPRVDAFLSKCFGLEPTPYHVAVSRTLLLGMTARLLKPGCVLEETVVLYGEQSCGKSEFCRILGGFYEEDKKGWFTDHLISMSGASKDSSDTVSTSVVVEAAELTAMNKRERNEVKAFLSRATEIYRPAYRRDPIERPRACIIIGTTNDHKFLHDPTGNRRFLPVSVSGGFGVYGFSRPWLQANRDQALAEAAHRFSAGEAYKFPMELWADAEAVRMQHTAPNPVQEFLKELLQDRPAIFATDMEMALRQAGHNPHNSEKGNIMHRLGYTADRYRIGGKLCRVWRKTSVTELKDEMFQLTDFQWKPSL